MPLLITVLYFLVFTHRFIHSFCRKCRSTPSSCRRQTWRATSTLASPTRPPPSSPSRTSTTTRPCWPPGRWVDAEAKVAALWELKGRKTTGWRCRGVGERRRKPCFHRQRFTVGQARVVERKGRSSLVPLCQMPFYTHTHRVTWELIHIIDVGEHETRASASVMIAGLIAIFRMMITLHPVVSEIELKN